MANPLFNQMNQNQLFRSVEQLKNQLGGDPNKYIQQMLNSGRITQDQYNQAVQRAQELKKMFNQQ